MSLADEPTPTPPSAADPSPVAVPRSGGAFNLLLTAVVALGCGLGGAYLFTRYFGGTALDHHESTTTTTATATARPAGREPRAPTPSEMSDRIDDLKSRLAVLKHQVDDQAKVAVAPELAALQVRVADVSRMADGLAPLPGQFDHLTNRVAELSTQLSTLRNDVSSLQTRGGRSPRLASSGSVPRALTPAPIPEPTSASLDRGAALFREGRYQEALAVFEALERSTPDDARVWYFAALCNGFSTGNWNNGAVTLVEKGIAREAAGTPTSARIDDVFKGLTTSTGKNWLAAYRSRVDRLR